MTNVQDNKVLELFGVVARPGKGVDWSKVVKAQQCPFTDSKCIKVRKSRPEISIGTCSVRYGRANDEIVICPNRMLERRQVFTDCIHLLTMHEPGNELHVVREISIPGGSVDYFLASVSVGKVKDFVGIEFQTLDTTGTVWPERQRLLSGLGCRVPARDLKSGKSFGMNWKMTAKTTLIQLHHKVETLEHLAKHLVLVVQDHLLDYLERAFSFDHLREARVGDSLHVHAYTLRKHQDTLRLQLGRRVSTDAAGVARCLGLQAESKMEYEVIVAALEKKLSDKTLLVL